MDSRIREIEQWLAEAKDDLGECGREAYIRKLYLLDAEIRSVIKETGEIPGGVSPRRQEGRVRRLRFPTRITAGVAGGLLILLAATTVSFLAAIIKNPARPLEPTTHAASPDAGLGTTQLPDNGFVPVNMPGWEILPENWSPTPGAVLTAMVDQPAALDNLNQRDDLATVDVQAVSGHVPARQQSRPEVTLASSNPVPLAVRREAIDVVLSASQQDALDKGSKPAADSFYEQWQPVSSGNQAVDNGDKSAGDPVNYGDNSNEYELDLEELKRAFERTLDG